MALPIPTERQRLALAETVPPPANLRARVLARHRGRRIRRRAMRAVLPALLVLGLVLAPWAGRPGAGEPWRQAQAVEAVWRAEADFEWLQQDARARHLMDELRRLDEALARGPDAESAQALWQARHQALTRLLASRRDGRTAVLL